MAASFPQELEALMKLPGVGRYTAGALRAFAFDLPAAVVDGNVARVLSRVMDFSAPVDDTAGQKQMWEWAEALADPRAAAGLQLGADGAGAENLPAGRAGLPELPGGGVLQDAASPSRCR